MDGTTETAATRRDSPTVVAGDGVGAFVTRQGGRLYVWTTEHRCCSGGLTLLETGVTAPGGWKPWLKPIDGGGFELYLDGGGHGRPRTLVLELARRRRKVRAYWNDCAFVS
jgi:hypothetical protein